MDKNQDGVISEEEFLDGCERVRNNVDSLVNACMHARNNNVKEKGVFLKPF